LLQQDKSTDRQMDRQMDGWMDRVNSIYTKNNNFVCRGITTQF